MKVRVVLTVDIDAQACRDEYATEWSAAEIREMVKGAIADAAQTDGVVMPAGIIRTVTIVGYEDLKAVS